MIIMKFLKMVYVRLSIKMSDDSLFLERNQLQYIGRIGSGTFGDVYLVYSRQYRERFALKIIKCKYFNEGEFESLKQLDSPNIVRLYKF